MASLPAHIHDELITLLRRDFRFRKDRGDWLQQGQCPKCDKWEVYVRSDNPRVIKCGRLDRCGWDQHVKDRYPEIFDDWSKRFPKTPENPTAAADAYLQHGRHFDLLGLRDAYTQETFFDHDKRIGTATVRFQLPGGSWWERLIDQPGKFEKKANFAAGKSWRGHWWQYPGVTLQDLAAADEIWLTEGIFNAVSLKQNDTEAVSIMSASHYPELILAELRKAIANGPTPGKSPTLVWALDNGRAGAYWTREHVKRARSEGWTCGAALPRLEDEPGADLDWNDLHIRDRLKRENLATYRWHGDILIAPTATEKAFLLWQEKQWHSFHFTFATRTYWATYNATRIQETIESYAENRKLSVLDFEAKRDHAARECGSIEEIANCAFRALYFQRDEATDQSLYFFRIDFPSDTPSAKGGFSPTAVATSAEFKKRLIAVGGGAIWTGEQYQLDRIMSRQLPGIKRVETVEFTGYSKDHGAWLLGEIGVRDGRVHTPTEDGYFDFGKVAVKVRSAEQLLDIDYDPEIHNFAWVEDVWTAWGPRGFVILTFWFASYFAEQIRRSMQSFPFLELIGEPDSGKSTIIEFLWKLAGRDNYEGVDPSKATAAALARNMGKVANLPVVLIEGDRKEDTSHARKFDWNELKTAFNGRSVRARGVKSDGMETFEPLFRGAIVIEQNDPVVADRAVMERICHVFLDKSDWSEATKEAAQRIADRQMKTVSAFIIHAALQEARVMKILAEKFPVYERQFLDSPTVRSARLAKNHAQLWAMLDAMRGVIPISDAQYRATADLVASMCTTRQLAINSDHEFVEQFWERFDWLELNQHENTDRPINHSRDGGLIAVNMVEFEARCADRRLQIPPMADLKRQLKTSKVRRFVDSKTVNSVTGKALHCWVFQKPAGGASTRKEIA